MRNEFLPTFYERMVHDNVDAIAPIIAEMCGGEEMVARGWRIMQPSSQEVSWIFIVHSQVEKRQQGWKLHISASIPSIEHVLRCALPVLLAERTCFKVIASLNWLRRLNNGEAGLSQVGKCITVYPIDDEQAVRLAVKLDQATQGLHGPTIRSDRALRPGSLVHYRYGGFAERFSYTRSGTLQPVIEAPTGELIEDRRGLAYSGPAWIQDPFLAAGVSEAPASGLSVLRDRYLLVGSMHQSPRGAVYDTVDLQQARRCLLKSAYRNAGLSHDLRDARDILRNEANILAQLAPLPLVPRMYDCFEDGDDLWLAIEYIEGKVLERYMCSLVNKGETLPLTTLFAWIEDLATILDDIHQRQIVYRDLKALNVIVTCASKLRLVDFGLAHSLTSSRPQFHGGTPGYASPEQKTNQPASIADDIYSLGALLYYLVSGANPFQAPEEASLLQRPIAVLNPHVPDALCRLIVRCLAPDPAQRYVSMQEVMADVQEMKSRPFVEVSYNTIQISPAEQSRYYTYAQELSETLAVVVQTAVDGKGPVWAQLTPSSGSKLVLRDLGNGLAGVLFVIALFVERLPADHLRSILKDGTHWLLRSRRLAGPLLPGLFVGEAGISAALLRAGQVLEDTTLVDAALEMEHLVVSCAYDLPDIFDGTAGRVKYHLMLWKITGGDDHLQAAVQAGNVLVEQAVESPDSGLYWQVPQGHGDLEGQVYPGYAHGVAGVADALLDLYQSTGQPEFLHAVQRAADWLIYHARVVNQRGAAWSRLEGEEEVCPAFWCHGSGGIGRFFLHAAQEHILPQALDQARKCGHAVAEGTRWAGPSRCHGLAGNIELLLDLYAITGEQEWLHAAHAHAQLLETFATEREGARVWFSEGARSITAGFLSGYAGVAMTMLRLGTIDNLIKPDFPRIL